MFSERTSFIGAPTSFSEAVAARRRESGALLDLTESNPTAVGLPPLPDAMRTALAGPSVLRYVPDPAGPRAIREAVAEHYARLGVAVDPDHLRLSASTSEAYGWLLKLLCDAGDAVLVAHPSYPLLDDLARFEGVALRAVPSTFAGRWELDVEGFAAAADSGARAIALVHPNNPTGAYVSRDEREALCALARARGLALVVDEVFLEYPLRDGVRVESFARCDDVLTFTLAGLSKSLALPQMKLGWVHVSGPAELRDEALRRLEHIADSYLSVGAPVLAAAPAWLAQATALQAPVRARIATNLATLRRVFDARSAATLRAPEGGWSAVLRLPATDTDEGWARTLLSRGVVVHPGYLFDATSETCVVLSLIVDPGVFAAGIEALREAVDGSG